VIDTNAAHVLAAAILIDSPRLHGALCRGKAPAFDHYRRTQAAEVALKLCGSCPVRRPCREWADSRTDVSGVVAGEIRSINRSYSTPHPTLGQIVAAL